MPGRVMADAVANPAGASCEPRAVHPRDRACTGCGAEAGKPCRLGTVKVLEDVHCTVRVTGRAIEPLWRPSSSHQTPVGYSESPDPPAPSSQTDTGVPDKLAPLTSEPDASENPSTAHPKKAPGRSEPVEDDREETSSGEDALFITERRQPALF